METQKTFSKFFQAGGCELQTGRCSTTQSLSPTFYSLAVVVMNFYFFMHETESLCFHDLGVYESFDTICIYLESDQAVGNDPNKNFRVRYRMAVVNQKKPTKTMWKESSICTKTWNNLVLQFMKVSDMLEADAGFLDALTTNPDELIDSEDSEGIVETRKIFSEIFFPELDFI
ncbi:hypothetical protein JHK87_031985 [Glycine soja]|nr:hypothetical protein JHK87_031985 [Glycine soja]